MHFTQLAGPGPPDRFPRLLPIPGCCRCQKYLRGESGGAAHRQVAVENGTPLVEEDGPAPKVRSLEVPVHLAVAYQHPDLSAVTDPEQSSLIQIASFFFHEFQL